MILLAQAPALPLHKAGPYVAAAYIVFVTVILIYVTIMAVRLRRDERQLDELRHELLERSGRGARANQEAGTASEEESAGETLDRVLGELSPRDRLVLTLMYWEEMPVAEIARQTGWTQGMVKVQAHRARKRLRRLLEAGAYPTSPVRRAAR